eukprot:5275347-Prymnesium_polylepis.1
MTTGTPRTAWSRRRREESACPYPLCTWLRPTLRDSTSMRSAVLRHTSSHGMPSSLWAVKRQRDQIPFFSSMATSHPMPPCSSQEYSGLCSRGTRADCSRLVRPAPRGSRIAARVSCPPWQGGAPFAFYVAAEEPVLTCAAGTPGIQRNRSIAHDFVAGRWRRDTTLQPTLARLPRRRRSAHARGPASPTLRSETWHRPLGLPPVRTRRDGRSEARRFQTPPRLPWVHTRCSSRPV